MGATLMWFRPPPVTPRNAGRIQLATGEEIILSKSMGYSIKSWSTKQIIVTNGEKTLTIPAKELMSVTLPK